ASEVNPHRNLGSRPEGHSGLFRRAVCLLAVARGAGRDRVLPGVTSASGLRKDVVDGVGRLATVSALVVVTLENAVLRPMLRRYDERHLDEAKHSDYDRPRHVEVG